ncbi:hypothetical protein HWV62_44848 [Athelia sp. TMB]|nr:hypothetical protein HWV62_44848 [Athelia sp. TMB]
MSQLSAGPTHQHGQSNGQIGDHSSDHSHTPNQHHSHSHSHTGNEKDDEAPLIVMGPGSASVLVPNEDVLQLWLTALDLTPILIPVLLPAQMQSDKHDTTSGVNTSKPTALLVPSPSFYYTSSPDGSETPNITPTLVQFFLPPPPARGKLWAAALTVLAGHPGILPFAKELKGRVDGMFKWATETGAVSGGGKAGEAAKVFFGGVSRETSGSSSKKPTVSFFAATAAVFALGAQALARRGVAPSSPARPAKRLSASGSGPGSGNKRAKMTTSGSPAPELRSAPDSVSHSSLLGLSEQACDLAERVASHNGAYDLDFLVALQLRALCMLNDGARAGAKVDGRVYPLVCKMVAIARMMGLARDPSEAEARWTVWEAERRRRVWWGVFWWDLYISDCMGHPPFIADHTFTTRLPAEVDEATFESASASMPTPSEDNPGAGYFRVKIRLAQLVKRTKTRLYWDPSVEDLPSIDDAFACHTDVKNFLADLPPAYHLEGRADAAQRYELAVTAHRLVLQIYLPFLRVSHAGTSSRAHATLEAMQAAHTIVAASRLLHSSGEMVAMEGYAYGQALFGAAVVCSHAVIGDASAIWAHEGLTDVRGALDILRDAGGAESVKVVEALLAKTEASVAGAGATAGGKRKHGEMENEGFDMPIGFCLPYAGPGVAASSDTASDESEARGNSPLVNGQRSRSPEGDWLLGTDKGKGKEKKLKHPPHGVRKRSAEEGPSYMREKFNTPPTAAASDNTSEIGLRLPSPAPTNSYNYAMPIEHETPAYEQPLSADLIPPPPTNLQGSFGSIEATLQFSVDQGNQRGYSPAAMDSSQVNFQGSVHSPTTYDNGFNGKSPVIAEFPSDLGSSYMPPPMRDHFSAQPYLPQNYRTSHHIPMSVPGDGMTGAMLRPQYEEMKPYAMNTQFRAHDQNYHQSWEQSQSSGSAPQTQLQFWPQNGFYQS